MNNHFLPFALAFLKNIKNWRKVMPAKLALNDAEIIRLYVDGNITTK
jgi:hypothetical protein